MSITLFNNAFNNIKYRKECLYSVQAKRGRRPTAAGVKKPSIDTVLSLPFLHAQFNNQQHISNNNNNNNNVYDNYDSNNNFQTTLLQHRFVIYFLLFSCIFIYILRSFNYHSFILLT